MSPLSFQDMSGTIDALIGHLQDMERFDAVNLMQIAVKEYGGSESASANSGPMLGKWGDAARNTPVFSTSCTADSATTSNCVYLHKESHFGTVTLCTYVTCVSRFSM